VIVTGTQPLRAERGERGSRSIGVAGDFVLDADNSSWSNAGMSECSPSGSPGDLLELIRRRSPITRAELASITGLARSTIAQRIDVLIAEGLIGEIGEAVSTGGRPPTMLGFNSDSGIVLVADLGATHSRLAVCDLDANPLAETYRDIAIADGPDSVLYWVLEGFDALIDEIGRSAADVRGIGVGVPGPVDFSAGRAVHPPIMPGWDDFPIRDRFVERYDVPVLVDNDVNIMALGEYWVMHPKVDDFIFVKVGTGIGSGLILDGRLHRGAKGAAGDIGHVQAGSGEVVCRCGNLGCLEASAGGAALERSLREKGHDAEVSRDVVALVRAGNHDAIQAVRDAGRLIGRVLATTVNLLNPAVVSIGGDIAEAGQQLLAGIRETVYQRSTALSTNELRITTGTLGDRAGVIGAAALIIEHVLDPDTVNAALNGTTSGGGS
jgi:predicted NBD/HSP70 family sugar kinase